MTDKGELSQILNQVKDVLNSDLSLAEIEQKLDEIMPSGCNRSVTKEEGTSEECNTITGNPFRYRHCVEITDCADSSDNMPKTCGQWKCYG